jgi:hypothetical protein
MESIVYERRFDFIRITACPELPQRLHIDGREVSPPPTFDAQILNNVTAFRSHDENRPEGERRCL